MTDRIVAMTTLALLVAAAPAHAGRPAARLNAVDQTAARAVLVRRAELPNSGWAGGFQTPDLSRTLGCPGFRPKRSDLVVTGAADSLIHHTGIELFQSSRVYRTARMVELEWRRSLAAARATACVRTLMTGGLPSAASPKVVSFAVAGLPRLAPHQRWYRLVADLGPQRVGYDMLFASTGRTAISLTMAYVFGTAGSDAAEQLQARRAELQLARAMLERVTA